MNISSYKISDSLYLVSQSIVSGAASRPASVPTDHVFALDVSGSMAGDLPRIREQLKRQLPKLLKEGDTFSMIWFSGRGQCGILLEGEPVASLKDLNIVNGLIDRWLKPVGMTGFKEPLELAAELVGRLKKKHPTNACAFVFFSDGCDNQWPRTEALIAIEKVAPLVSSITIVEYGFYADRPLLAKMAERAGGALIFARDFDAYAPSFETLLQKEATGEKRFRVIVDGDPIDGFVFSIQQDAIVAHAVEEGAGGVDMANVPDSIESIFYLQQGLIGEKEKSIAELAKLTSEPLERKAYRGGKPETYKKVDPSKVICYDIDSSYPAAMLHQAPLSAAYAAVSLYSVRMRPAIVYPLLRALGDVRLIEMFAGCFGKQAYSDFMEVAKECAYGRGRYECGYDPKKVPRDDAFTLFDMLSLLASDENNRVLLDHPSFQYNRISRGKVDSNSVLTTEEITEVSRLTNEIPKAKKNAKKIADIMAKIEAITSKKLEPPKFVPDPAPEGYPIENLTYNEEHANISILVRKTGVVDISKTLPVITSDHVDFLMKMPEADMSKVLPAITTSSALLAEASAFPTFIWRNYAMVKDGLVNVGALPMRLSPETMMKLFTLHHEERFADDVIVSGPCSPEAGPSSMFGTVTLNFEKLPILNRSMVAAPSAEALFRLEWDLIKVQSLQKVYKHFLVEAVGTKKSPTFEAKYGKLAAEWLKEAGFTEYSGFAPKSEQADVTDVYRAKELKVAIKGFSAVPSLNEYRKSPNRPACLLMKPAMDALSKPIVNKKVDTDELIDDLQKQTKTFDRRRRALLAEKAKLVFSIIVGQVWFKEFASLDETSMTLELDGEKRECSVTMREVDVKI